MVRKALGAAVPLATVLAFVAQARADIVYWGNQSPNRISFATLDGSSSGDLNTSGAVVTMPDGTALDPAHGRIFWANGNAKISFANLDGSGGGGTINTAGATITDPVGLALDPIAGRVYWANEEDQNNAIGYANLDGSGGGDLNTGDATLDVPNGVAVDPAAGLIYWTNNGPSRAGVSFARLDGSGGGDLTLFSTTGGAAGAVAVDPLNQRAWWTNLNGSKVEFIGLNGSGRGSLATSATVAIPLGLALDPDAQRVYWANASTLVNKISFASFDGSASGDVNPGTATVHVPDFPVLLKPPSAIAPPVVSGGSAPGSTLSCSTGEWAGDLSPAHLYRAPQRFAYQWSLNGAPVNGATSSTTTAGSAGDYRCSVTASNQAGPTTQTSSAFTVPGGGSGSGAGGASSGGSGGSGGTVSPPGPPSAGPILPPSNAFSVGRVRGRVLPVDVSSRGTLAVADARSRATAAKRRRKRATTSLKPTSATGGPGTISVALRLTRQASAKLKRRGRLRVAARLTFTPSGGAPATQTTTLGLTAAKHRRVRRR